MIILAKRINIGPWINVGHKENVKNYVEKKPIKLESIHMPWKKFQN